ncbi:flagellin N-methylase [bacterium BMS3Abin01]|nr:flagellin N-methylase [bacterium BMS3Abin01]
MNEEDREAIDRKPSTTGAGNSPVVPKQLTLESRLQFRCHPGIDCFTRCCSDIDIMLTPYDVIRMKQRLGISSDRFLERYTRSRIEEKTGWPQLLIKMEESSGKPCPFVTTDGCTIYTDRPAMCRYYPIGQGIHRKQVDDQVVNEEFYMLIREEHCHGFSEERQWTIAEWRENQEAEHYDRMAGQWKELFVRNITREEEKDGRRQTMFFLASYNLDQFRRFVLESRFLETFDIDAEETAAIREDDVQLMNLAFRYLRYLFGVEKTLSLREGVLPEEEPGGEGA